MKKLDTVVQVVLNEQQIKDAISRQIPKSNKDTVLKLHELSNNIKQLRVMVQTGVGVIKGDVIVPTGFGYRASTEINNLEDRIMRNINIVEMPENWY